jgi:hypothetical protein
MYGGSCPIKRSKEARNGQRPRIERQERQAVRRSAQEGDEQGTRGEDRQHEERLEERREEVGREEEVLARRERSESYFLGSAALANFNTWFSVAGCAEKDARSDSIEMAPPRGGWSPMAMPRTQFVTMHPLIIF